MFMQEHSGAVLTAMGLSSQMWAHGSFPAGAERKVGCFTEHGPSTQPSWSLDAHSSVLSSVWPQAVGCS